MSISDIIKPHIPYLIEEGFNLDWFTRFKLLLTPSANSGFLSHISFKDLTIYYNGRFVTLDNESSISNNLLLSTIHISCDTAVRGIDYDHINNQFNITQSIEYENLKPIKTNINIYDMGTIIGNPTYKLSKLSGIEISEKLILKVENKYISVYYNGNRVNKIIGNYRISVHYDENGIIRKVE